LEQRDPDFAEKMAEVLCVRDQDRPGAEHSRPLSTPLQASTAARDSEVAII